MPNDDFAPARHGADARAAPSMSQAAVSPVAPAPRSGEATDRVPLPFGSILYLPGQDAAAHAPRAAPACFRDLNIDQIVASIVAGKDEYDLTPFLYAPLRSVDQIEYRHEVMRDLEQPEVAADIVAFADSFRAMREKLAHIDKLFYKQQKERWFLHAVEIYHPAVTRLCERLASHNLSSRGLRAFHDYLNGYVASDGFVALGNWITKLRADLASVHYCIHIQGDSFKVRKYEGEQDYSVEIIASFEKFRQGSAKDYLVGFHEPTNVNHVEAKVLEFVALLYPEIFGDLEAFANNNRQFADATIVRFDREVQFYLSYADLIRKFRNAGMHFCYPTVSATSKEISAQDAFDLSLGIKLLPENAPIVTNDFALRDPERIMVISGPNQGGKTTFSRTFGQMHYLASLGYPVTGSSARLYLFDAIFTHFEREEDIRNLHGKLQDDLVRIHEILEQATPRSVVIINEIFNSTTLRDAVFLARKMMDRLIELDVLCVCVTFLDELASLGEKTVSMMSTVVPDNPAVRTFKVVRRPADGSAYAISIAEKYRLTYDWVKKRVAGRSVATGGRSAGE
jgi:DNA mismatch repair protein MutS